MIELRDEACPACDSRRQKVLGEPGKVGDRFRDFPEVEAVRVVRCSDCSAMYISPMTYFSDKLQKDLYNINYFSADGRVQDLKNIEEKRRILRITQQWAEFSLTGKTLLDIGCGTGEFLVTASNLGMVVTGIDLEVSITKYIRDKYGFDVMSGPLRPETFPKERFDVIILSHVIEHLQKPFELLAVINATLKNDGLFVMCTPNTDSLMENVHDIFGRVRHAWSKTYYLTPFTSPYHLIGFNLKSSRRILDRAGFAPVYCKLHSGLEWEDNNHKLIMKAIKIAGAILGKGMSLVTVSRKSKRRSVQK